MKLLPLLAAACALVLPAHACKNCFGTPPPQPADGAYTISAALPGQGCYWLYLSELKEGEDMAAFLERTGRELYAQLSLDRQREEEMGEAAPVVCRRGIVLRNPAAAPEWRDATITCLRDNNYDEPGWREQWYNLFLAIDFSPQGIALREGRGGYPDYIEATGTPRFWSWSRSGDFLAALPGLLHGDPKEAVLPLVPDLNPVVLERIKSGRRMVIFHAEAGMPLAEHWECFAHMAAIVGGQCLAFSSYPRFGSAPKPPRLDADMLQELRQGLPEPAETPTPELELP